MTNEELEKKLEDYMQKVKETKRKINELTAEKDLMWEGVAKLLNERFERNKELEDVC